MKSNKIILLLIMFIVIATQVFAVDYSKTTGDSLFVVGVDWQKQASSTTYIAYVTVDLNYGQYVNPLNRYAVVNQYFWNNWWSDSAQFGSAGIIGAGINTTDGIYTFQKLDFYYELPDIKIGSEADDYQCNVQGICGDIVPTTRIGYYGLPFYIQTLEFVCDSNNTNKGGITITPSNSDIDIITLTRPNYEGIPNAEITVETATVPLGFGTRPSEIVRYNGLPVVCSNMDSTENARLSFVLKPNALYRHVNPNIEDSEKWEYSTILSSLPSVANSRTLPFNLNIDFNFSGNFWDYEIDTSTELEGFENAYFSGNNYDLICSVTNNLGSVEQLNFRELSADQQLKVNTGETACSGEQTFIGCSGALTTVQCSYPKDQTVENLNNKKNNDILQTLSLQNQKLVVLQLDLLAKKQVTKEFVAKTIIPFFVLMMVLIFYVFQLIALGVAFLGLIPLMFKQMLRGLQDVFDIDAMINEKKIERGMVKKK